MTPTLLGKSHWDVVVSRPTPFEISLYKELYDAGVLRGVIWFGSYSFVVLFNWFDWEAL